MKLILAGDEKLSIRSFRGARPDLFADLAPYAPRPLTLLPELAFLRGNGPFFP